MLRLYVNPLDIAAHQVAMAVLQCPAREVDKVLRQGLAALQQISKESVAILPNSSDNVTMIYETASALGKLRAMAAYHGAMVHDGLEETDAVKWCNGTFTEEDAARMVPLWEESFTQEPSDWKQVMAMTYQNDLANSSTPEDCTQS